MLKIMDYEVYGLERAAIASGLPMSVDSNTLTANIKRLSVLGRAKPGSGHDCSLKGISVALRVKYPLYWGKQFQRYHFADIVSSQSTMHRITQMDLDKCFNEYTSKAVINIIKSYVFTYNYMVQNDIDEIYLDNKEVLRLDKPDGYYEVYDRYKVFMRIISTCPSGLEMEMEITTNYLQLKTIYEQRRNHKLKEDWGPFCDWIETLPVLGDIVKPKVGDE